MSRPRETVSRILELDKQGLKEIAKVVGLTKQGVSGVKAANTLGKYKWFTEEFAVKKTAQSLQDLFKSVLAL
jgi:hypothetical protein